MRHSTLYKIAGPKTLRLSSNKILGKWGYNLQNVKKELRIIYESDSINITTVDKLKHYLATRDVSIFNDEERDKLRILTQSDQSGAEALIVAYCCEAGQYRELFKQGIKPHSFLAMHLFKLVWQEKLSKDIPDFSIDLLCALSITDLKKHPHWSKLDKVIKKSDEWSLQERYYYLAKQTEHSSNFDIQPPMFRMNVLEKSGGKIVISKPDSERFLATKFALFPEIKGYHRYVEKCVKQDKILYNMHGHPYVITQHEIRDNQIKEYYAWISQSTVGEITNMAYTRMYEYAQDNRLRWDMLQNNHDSLLTQSPLGEEQEVGRKQREFLGMSFISPIDGANFQMKSETQYGFNWCPYKPIKNELGLREYAS